MRNIKQIFYSKSGDVAALSATKQDWFAWLSRANAYSNVHNGRSYVEVLTAGTDKTVRKPFLKSVHTQKKSQQQRKPSTLISIPQVRTPQPNRVFSNSHFIPHKEYTPFAIKTNNKFAALSNMDCAALDTVTRHETAPLLSGQSVSGVKTSSKSNSRIKCCNANNNLDNSLTVEHTLLGDIDEVKTSNGQ